MMEITGPECIKLDSPCKAGALALFHFGVIISDYCQHQVSISTYVTKRHVLTKVDPSMQFLLFSTFSKKKYKKAVQNWGPDEARMNG